MLCLQALRRLRCRCLRRGAQVRPTHADAHAELGTGAHSTLAEIKAQYYRICRQLHPDAGAAGQAQVPSLLRGVSQAQWQAMDGGERQAAVREQFLAARDAYEALADPALRSRHHATRQRAAPRAGDPWAAERPRAGPPPTAAEERRERAAAWALLGLLGMAAVVAGAQQQLAHERRMQRLQAEDLLSARLLDAARERALEKCREVPPAAMGEFEARWLRTAQARAAGADAGSQGELHRLWPHGAGLGLLAVLRDSQLCGVDSRRQVAADPALAQARPAARRTLARDPVVARYLA
ncbi:hypothetical protein IWQ57_000200 [Coemansia nantahalensis]|uniref:Uncharacterized protein n=1 Tax=Coemansia nantahalensis TaxID=2789366 RepID=A0ACC1K8A7_9FUNG|nr:hypothetical protein IWQ57_000200 [Coemansia nantahalensis]